MQSKIKIAKYKPLKIRDGFTMVEEEKGKCLIAFPMYLDGEVFCDENLGLIAILLQHNIVFDNVYIRLAENMLDEYDDPGEVVFEFNKKHTNEIRSVEKAYFEHKILIDAQEMSLRLMFVIDNLESWRTKLISEYEKISKKGKKKNKLSKK